MQSISFIKQTVSEKKNFNKHFSKNKNETAEIANFLFSHYKSMKTESCHSYLSSYLTGTKDNFFCRG